MRRAVVAILILLLVSPGALSGVATAQEAVEPDLSWLEECGSQPRVLCGTVSRPLDPENPAGDAIDINLELYPARDQTRPPLGTVVAVEGGPGYATTASRDYYLDLFQPLMSRHQLLLVDNRGTGYSAPIDCPELQSYEGEYYANVALCGEQLGDTSDLWGSAFAADDLAAVLDALGIDRVDLYGDSYGTFFGQTFAVRHPDRVRTLVLDAAYPIKHQDPWYRDLNRAVVDSFERVCERDPGCVDLGVDPVEDLRKLADVLAVEPLVGSAPDADGVVREVSIDPSLLSYLAAVATFGVPVYRELSAAGRAFLDNDDPLPLLRIAAEQTVPIEAYPLEESSEGLYVAVACNDYPQLWDINASLDQRPSQYSGSVDALTTTDPDAFAPFTVDEWLASLWADFEMCMGWPPPSNWVPPVTDDEPYPEVPTLVLVGDLDSVTSPEGAAIAAGHFPNSTYVEVANVGHVTALSDFSRCASDIVLRFVRTGGDPGDTGCASRYNEIRTVEHFARQLADIEKAPGLGTGRRGRAVLAAAHTIADMIARWYSMYGEEGVGLRGGSFTTSGLNRVRFRMDGLRWVEDLEVSGTARWDRATGAIIADLDLSGGASGRLTLSWNDWRPLAKAHAVGTVEGKRVNWWFAAP